MDEVPHETERVESRLEALKVGYRWGGRAAGRPAA